ncbi:MAG TPA: hypothetical protein VFF53_04710 [Geobacteraceae bacterium]|nr:hypothetical protein [Geobacteraceae bacterium]
MMSYLCKKLALLAAVLVMAGCAVQQYAKATDVAEYPYHYADFDYKYAWKTTATDHGVAIDGVMKNVRYSFIDSVVMTVEVLGKDGRIVARATDFATPQQSRQGDVIRFALLLRDSKPTAGDTFRFRVHYTGNDVGNQGGVDWVSSFEVDALTGAVIRPPSRHPDKW